MLLWWLVEQLSMNPMGSDLLLVPSSHMLSCPWTKHQNSIVALSSTVWQLSINKFPKGFNKVCHFYYY